MRKGIICLVLCLIISIGLVSCGRGSSNPSGSASDTAAPSVPTGLTATAASSSSIALNWTASTDDTDVTGYKIFRNGTQINTSTTNAFSDTGLSSSTTYTYTVSAYDAAGNNSAQSTPSSATTLATGVTDTTPPSAPTNLTATAMSSSQIDLSWTASTDNIGVAGYEIYRDAVLITTVTGTTYSDTGLSANTSYTYTVKAFDGANNKSITSASATAKTHASDPTGDTQAPTVPTGLSVTADSSIQMNLSWTASTDDIAVTGYKIYRDGVYLKSVATITALDSGLTASTQYCYSVSAYDAASNESAQTSQTCATTKAPWELATIDTGSMRNASMTLDANGKVHVVYYDNSNYTIKYATNGSGVWSTETLTTFTKKYSSSMAKPSLAVDSGGKVHIVYLESDSSVSYSCGGGGASIKYLTNASGSWTMLKLDSSVYVGDPWLSIVIDGNDKLYIAYPAVASCPAFVTCKYLSNVSGSWATETITWSGTQTLSYFYNNAAELALDSNNKAHIIFSKDGDSLLRYLTNVSGNWNTTTIENTTGYTSGHRPSVTNFADNLHISYTDGTSIKYSNNTTGSWTSSSVLTGTASSSIVMDSSSIPHVVSISSDGVNYLLKYASLSSLTWTIGTVESASSGFDLSGKAMAADANRKIHIVYVGPSGLEYAEQQ